MTDLNHTLTPQQIGDAIQRRNDQRWDQRRVELAVIDAARDLVAGKRGAKTRLVKAVRVMNAIERGYR